MSTIINLDLLWSEWRTESCLDRRLVRRDLTVVLCDRRVALRLQLASSVSFRRGGV